MNLFSETVAGSGSPFELARRLVQRRGVVLSASDAGPVYLACDPIAESAAIDPEPELWRSPRAFGDVPRWFGLVPYETCRTFVEEGASDSRPPSAFQSPLWLRYGAVARITQGRVEVMGDDASGVRALARALRSPPVRSGVEIDWAARPEAGSVHAARIRRALVHIAAGDIYEINLARRFDLRVAGTATDLLDAMSGSELPSHGFALQLETLRVAAASPELCLSVGPSGRLLTRPIKGTRPRGRDSAEDAALAAELDGDPKERAELTMIIDVERNDLGRVAEIGSVRLVEPPHVVTLPTVHHRQAAIEAVARTGVSRAELLAAILPSGSVTGAPKRRAMELIAELEPERRGLYTGAAGFIRHDGGLELSMMIRTLSAVGEHGSYYSGGGIVADSDPEREVEETLWKAERLRALLSVGVTNGTAKNWSVGSGRGYL